MTGPKLNESPVRARRTKQRGPAGQSIKSTAKFVRISPYKVRVVLDLIRGHDVAEAANVLRFCERDAAFTIGKVLRSAVANAVNNDDIPAEELYVSACYADEGPTIKRFRPRARGRTGAIRKRTSHITVVVSRLPEALLSEARNVTAAAAENRARRTAGARATAETTAADTRREASGTSEVVAGATFTENVSESSDVATATTAAVAGALTGAAVSNFADTGSADSGSVDTASTDTGSADTGSVDTDTGSADTGSVDTDTASADTTSADTTSVDTASADTTSADTASTDTAASVEPTPFVDTTTEHGIDTVTNATQTYLENTESITDLGTATSLFVAPAGDPDELNKIIGIGPALALRLNEIGVTQFAQLAEMSDADIERLDAAVPRSFDQISDWRTQAQEIIAGTWNRDSSSNT
jgi:large subunit ribosomal protein L22